MSAAWRIFRRDFRRFWPLGLALAALTFFLADFPQLGVTPRSEILVDCVNSLQPILLGLIMILVVQSDMATTDRADWITRPFSGWSIAGAKLAFAILVLALPAGLIDGLAARPYGLSWMQCALAGGGGAGKTAAEALFFGLIGGVTPGLLGAVVLFAGGAIVMILAVPYFRLLFAGHRLPELFWWSFPISGFTAIALAIVLGAHYRWRRTAASIAVALGASAALFFIQGHLFLLFHRGTPSTPAPAGVGLLAQSPHGFVGGVLSRPYPLSGEPVVGLQVSYAVPEPTDYRISIGSAEFASSDGRKIQEILPLGASIKSTANQFQGLSTSWLNLPQAAQTEFGIRTQGHTPPSLIPVMVLPESQLSALRGVRGALRLSCYYARTRLDDHGILALEPGAALRRPGLRFRIESIFASQGPSIQIKARETRLPSLGTAPNLVWALVNEATGEVSLEEYGGSWGQTSSDLVRESFPNMAFAHRWRRGSAEVAAGVDHRWLKTARLEYFSVAYEFSHPFQAVVPDFTFPSIGGSR